MRKPTFQHLYTLINRPIDPICHPPPLSLMLSVHNKYQGSATVNITEDIQLQGKLDVRGGKLYTFGGYHNDHNSSYKHVLYTYSLQPRDKFLLNWADFLVREHVSTLIFYWLELLLSNWICVESNYFLTLINELIASSFIPCEYVLTS